MGDKLKQNDSPGVVQDFEEQERCIRLIAKELLSSDTVDVVIGFQEDDIGGSLHYLQISRQAKSLYGMRIVA